MEAREGESAGGDDQRAEQPRGPRTPSVRRDIEFHRYPEKGGDLFPPFIGWRAVEVRTFGFFGQPLDFGNRKHLAHFLREFGRSRLRLLRNQRVNFMRVEPHEVAVLASGNVS